tara:strand:- start:60 stop:839 length:780 start_codon:yes stop_codon:yes gene_type:complete
MFLKGIKKDTVFLDCYTASRYAYNYAKIDYAKRYIPEWWKDHPNLIDGMKTIKHCTAFTDYYAKGIVIPLWGEVEITVHPVGDTRGGFEWRSSNKDFDLTSGNHAKGQWGGFGNDNMLNVKFSSPWAFKTRDLVHFAWSQPSWSQSDTFNGLTGLPAVVEYKTQSITHINYLVEQKSEEQKFRLMPLTPIAMLHPLTERKVELRHHLVDSETMEIITRRAGGMLLDSSNEDVLRGSKGYKSKKNSFWNKADELNKCPFQ